MKEADGDDVDRKEQSRDPKQIGAEGEEEEEEYYENDSFIIDDDGGNDRDGDLTGSSARFDKY